MTGRDGGTLLLGGMAGRSKAGMNMLLVKGDMSFYGKGKDLTRGGQRFFAGGMSRDHAPLGVICGRRPVTRTCRGLFNRRIEECGRNGGPDHRVPSCVRRVQRSGGNRGLFCRGIIRINAVCSYPINSTSNSATSGVLSRCVENFRREGPGVCIFGTILRLSRTAPRLRVS